MKSMIKIGFGVLLCSAFSACLFQAEEDKTNVVGSVSSETRMSSSSSIPVKNDMVSNIEFFRVQTTTKTVPLARGASTTFQQNLKTNTLILDKPFEQNKFEYKIINEGSLSFQINISLNGKDLFPHQYNSDESTEFTQFYENPQIKTSFFSLIDSGQSYNSYEFTPSQNLFDTIVFRGVHVQRYPSLINFMSPDYKIIVENK